MCVHACVCRCVPPRVSRYAVERVCDPDVLAWIVSSAPSLASRVRGQFFVHLVHAYSSEYEKVAQVIKTACTTRLQYVSMRPHVCILECVTLGKSLWPTVWCAAACYGACRVA